MMNDMNKIIAFAGKMRSGKGVASSVLKEKHNYSYLEVADAIKEICVKLTGLSNVEELNEYKNGDKPINLLFDENTCYQLSEETGVPLEYIKEKMLGKRIVNIRVLLQMLGTDVLRNYDKNWHIYRLADEIVRLCKENKPVVVGDIRFANEKLFIESIGGIVYYIDRKDNPFQSHHPSENSLSRDDFQEENIIDNNFTLADFMINVEMRVLHFTSH